MKCFFVLSLFPWTCQVIRHCLMAEEQMADMQSSAGHNLGPNDSTASAATAHDPLQRSHSMPHSSNMRYSRRYSEPGLSFQTPQRGPQVNGSQARGAVLNPVRRQASTKERMTWVGQAPLVPIPESTIKNKTDLERRRRLSSPLPQPFSPEQHRVRDQRVKNQLEQFARSSRMLTQTPAVPPPRS